MSETIIEHLRLSSKLFPSRHKHIPQHRKGLLKSMESELIVTFCTKLFLSNSFTSWTYQSFSWLLRNWPPNGPLWEKSIKMIINSIRGSTSEPEGTSNHGYTHWYDLLLIKQTQASRPVTGTVPPSQIIYIFPTLISFWWLLVFTCSPGTHWPGTYGS